MTDFDHAEAHLTNEQRAQVRAAVSELLPCPFCGAAATIDRVARDWWRINAAHDDNCAIVHHELTVPQTPDQRALAVAAWNQRATPTPLAAAAPAPDDPRPIPGSPAYALRGLYKPADYYVDGKPATPEEYIAWQAGIIESITKAKIPDPKYYGGSTEEGDQHEVRCAYVDGWNECRASILAAPTLPAAQEKEA
jgi:hypothetical protein